MDVPSAPIENEQHSADGGEARYRKVFEHTTAKKYAAEDTDTIDAELNNIEAKLP